LNASGCGGRKTGEEVGREKASFVEENTWFFPTRLVVSKLNREESQPISFTVGVVEEAATKLVH
jgi:hypothetical protein